MSNQLPPEIIDHLEVIKNSIVKKFAEVFQDHSSFENRLQKTNKDDKTPVTILDLFISDLVKKQFGMENFSFYSEEEKNSTYGNFPLLALDPVDGTRELARGYPECATSLAIMPTSELASGHGWIFAPLTGFLTSSADPFVMPAKNYPVDKILGMISRTEWEKGTLGKISHPNIMIAPKASIAYKLGLLACGACDFVVTTRPKNVWDIAAGSILCKQRNIIMYSNGHEISHFDTNIYPAPIIWCRPELRSLIESIL